MTFKRSSTTLFLDPNSDAILEYEKGDKLNVILSPSLYWVKKLTLPVKSVREVKKLLVSIFEDSLPEGHYSYTAYKSGDKFLLFAYEDKKILSLLNAKGVNLVDVSSIYFAQNEFTSLEGALSINATQSMYVKDELLVLAPSAWISESKELDLKNVELSKNTIKLQQFSHIVDNSSLYKIGAILVILAIILLVEIFVASSKRDAIVELQDEVFSKYKLQSTMFQNQSTKSKYNTIYKTQTKLRESIALFLTMKLKATQKITLIEYKNRVLHVTVSGTSKGQEKSVTSQLDSKGLKYKVSYNDASVKVEMKI